MQPADDDQDAAGSVLLLGVDHGDAEAIAVRRIGASACALSVGGPAAVERKRGADVPNEDALFAGDDGTRTLHVVADGHWGHAASHEAARRAADVVRAAGDLLAPVRSLSWTGGTSLTSDRSRTTIVACAIDRAAGALEGWSAGDSAVFLFRAGEAPRRLTEPRVPYAAPHTQPPLERHEVHAFRSPIAPGDVVLSCSDGVFECHYRSPDTSVTEDDLAGLVADYATDPPELVRRVTELALRGVRGSPGGEDNIAVVATRV